jgi:choline dehydrogenase-like flavoprotein
MQREKIGSFRVILGFVDPVRATININWEQAPIDDNRIVLAADASDPVFGQPTVRVDWRMTERDKRTVRRGLELCRQYLEARGGTDFRITTDLSGGPESWTIGGPSGMDPGGHPMGATRMSSDPADGIVDPNLRVHTTDNLYVASCSVFPTGGSANPTLTIIALAVRLAEHLRGG